MSCGSDDSRDSDDDNDYTSEVGATINNDIYIYGDSSWTLNCGVVNGDVYIEHEDHWVHAGTGFMYGELNPHAGRYTPPSGGGGSGGGGGGDGSSGGGGSGGGGSGGGNGWISDGQTHCPPFGPWHDDCSGDGYGGDGEGAFIPDESYWPERDIQPIQMDCEEFSWNDAAYQACLDVVTDWGDGGLGWFESAPAYPSPAPNYGDDGGGGEDGGDDGGDPNEENNENNNNNNNNNGGDTDQRQEEDAEAAKRDVIAAVVSTIGPPSVVQMYMSTSSDWKLDIDWEAWGQDDGDDVNHWLNVKDAASLTGIAINGLIEYQDANNDAMYNADDGDVIINDYSFGDSNIWQWESMLTQTVTLAVGSESYHHNPLDILQFSARANMINGATLGATFDIAFKMASREVILNGTTLNPNRTKVDIAFDGVYRTQPDTIIALDAVLVTSELDEDVDANELSDFMKLGKGYADWDKVAQNSTMYVDPTKASVGNMRVVSSGFREMSAEELNPHYAFTALVRRNMEEGVLPIRVLHTYFSFIDDCVWVPQYTPCEGLMKDDSLTSEGLCQASCCGDPSCALWQFNRTTGCLRGYNEVDATFCHSPQVEVDAYGKPYYANLYYVGGWRQNVKDPLDEGYSNDWAMKPMSCFWDPAISYGSVPGTASYNDVGEILGWVCITLVALAGFILLWIYRKRISDYATAYRKRRYSLRNPPASLGRSLGQSVCENPPKTGKYGLPTASSAVPGYLKRQGYGAVGSDEDPRGGRKDTAYSVESIYSAAWTEDGEEGPDLGASKEPLDGPGHYNIQPPLGHPNARARVQTVAEPKKRVQFSVGGRPMTPIKGILRNPLPFSKVQTERHQRNPARNPANGVVQDRARPSGKYQWASGYMPPSDSSDEEPICNAYSAPEPRGPLVRTHHEYDHHGEQKKLSVSRRKGTWEPQSAPLRRLASAPALTASHRSGPRQERYERPRRDHDRREGRDAGVEQPARPWKMPEYETFRLPEGKRSNPRDKAMAGRMKPQTAQPPSRRVLPTHPPTMQTRALKDVVERGMPAQPPARTIYSLATQQPDRHTSDPGVTKISHTYTVHRPIQAKLDNLGFRPASLPMPQRHRTDDVNDPAHGPYGGTDGPPRYHPTLTADPSSLSRRPQKGKKADDAGEWARHGGRPQRHVSAPLPPRDAQYKSGSLGSSHSLPVGELSELEYSEADSDSPPRSPAATEVQLGPPPPRRPIHKDPATQSYMADPRYLAPR